VEGLDGVQARRGPREIEGVGRAGREGECGGVRRSDGREGESVGVRRLDGREGEGLGVRRLEGRVLPVLSAWRCSWGGEWREARAHWRQGDR
jgi:hypothetical protein